MIELVRQRSSSIGAVIGVLLLLVLVKVGPTVTTQAEERRGLQPGDAQPAFELPAITGGSVHTDAFTDKPWVAVFLTPTCGFCGAFRAELLARDPLALGKNLVLIVRPPAAVAYDASGVWRDYTELARQYTVVVDSLGKVFERWQVYSYPTTYAVDATGNVNKAVVGHPAGLQLVESVSVADDRESSGREAPM